MLLGRIVRAVVRTLVVLAPLVVVGFAVLFALLWHEHNTATTLPKPTGQFVVGRTTYTWINNTETDDLAPSSDAKREVAVWIWYPAASTIPPKPVEYLPAAWRLAVAKYSGVLMSEFLTRDPSLVHAHSTSDPAISPAQPSYPVIIMRAGGGALTTDYTTLAEDLASHGYIVVGFDAPYRTVVFVCQSGRVIMRPAADNPENLPPGEGERLIDRLLPMWIGDTKFVVSQLQRLNASDPSGKFTGRLDMQQLGMFGHSFGGAQALQFCHEDEQCKAGIDLDGAPYGSVVQDGLRQPFMFILSDHSRESSNPASRKILADIQSIYDGLPNGGYFITIRGANHFSFSDQMLVKCPLLISLMRFGGFARLNGRRGLAITGEYVHTFFDVYLKDESPRLITNLSKRYHEVEFDQR